MDIMQNVAPTYVFTWKKRRYSWIECLLISTLFLSMLAVIFWLVYWDLLKLENVKKLAAVTSFPWFHFFLFFVILASNFAILKFNRSARLYIDSSGVRLKLLPESDWTILRFLEKELLWADLKDVNYMKRLQLIQLRSRLSGRHMGHMTIRLNDWQMQTTTHGSQANDAEPDLIKVLREFDIFEKYPSNSQRETSSFDLTKNAATKKLLLVLSCLVVYCFVDVMSQHEGYAFFNLSYCLPHIVSGSLIAVILAYLLFRASGRDFIPPGIIGVLAVMGGITFGTASYVAGIRINQFVGGPLLEARYHRDVGCENLLPEDTSLPVVEYTHMTRDYWCSKTTDEVLTIKVRKGLFGLYQFDLREHTQAIRDYRQKH